MVRPEFQLVTLHNLIILILLSLTFFMYKMQVKALYRGGVISDNVYKIVAQFLTQNRGLLNYCRKGKYRIYTNFM